MMWTCGPVKAGHRVRSVPCYFAAVCEGRGIEVANIGRYYLGVRQQLEK